MARGKKTGGKNFKKGVSGNPLGGAVRAIDPDIRKMMKQRRTEFVVEMQRQLRLRFEEVQELGKDFSLPSDVLLVSRLIQKAVSASDVGRAAFILDNAFGPQPKPLKLVDDEGDAYRPLATVPTEQLLLVFAELRRQVVTEGECKSTEKQPQPLGSLPPSSGAA